MNTTDTAAIREKFEVWWLRDVPEEHRAFAKNLLDGYGIDYTAAPGVADAWAAYQAGASASTQVSAQFWQPIASAPRYGTNILIRFGKDGVSQAKYVAGVPHPWKFIDTNDGITWLVNDARDGEYGPSHWQPMPSAALAPTSEQAEGVRFGAVELILRDICETDPADPDLTDTVCISAETLQEIVERHIGTASLLEWAVDRWSAEVSNRPLVNVHRRALDDTWRQVIRHCGGDANALIGPSHSELLDAAPAASARDQA